MWCEGPGCHDLCIHFSLSGDLFKGAAETGCWICLQNLNSLKSSALSVAGQLVAEVQQALRGNLPSVTLMSEDVTLSPTAACFATLNYLCEDPAPTISINLPVPDIGSRIPEECMAHFRLVVIDMMLYST